LNYLQHYSLEANEEEEEEEDHKKTLDDGGSVKSRAVVLEGLPEEVTTSSVGARGRQQQEKESVGEEVDSNLGSDRLT
jgi:hypothetical protein